jgi:Skp family chaperone for outer membrane proteins
MKKFLLLIVIITTSFNSFSQGKGVKIGYIDMEYILENVPDYKEASIQLDQKAQKWKEEIEVKKNAITKLNDNLKSEKALLTKELITEREDEVKFMEKDLIDYQQKRFGSNGDYIIQKASIAKPVQDQVFNAVQDLAEARGYDFIFDKSSDLTMLFSAKRHNLSERIVNTLVNAEKREQLSKKQLKAIEAKEAEKEKADGNPALEERQRILNEKKAIRDQALLDRKLSQEQKRKDFAEGRKKILENTAGNKSGTTIDSTSVNKSVLEKFNKLENKKVAQDSIKNSREAARLKILENNKKSLEERKKILDEKKRKIAADKEIAKLKK